ncbi:uncharacterized protein IL334_006522 [Kwoniella shivajii]|uniref:DUF6534 domain-containing protein n=1 Tax=Kwoniella shivajii TaxID=564305 RepID=A0ABZ1D663_9TREE|nr:hypothetical protein IL334_006522 [Kwoniella shivajii]
MSTVIGISADRLFAIYGPLEIGTICSIFGMGLLVVIGYFGDGSKGRWTTKSLVLVVLAVNFGQTISDCSRIIKLTTLHSADLLYFLNVRTRPEEVVSPILSVILSTITQLFLLRRCLLFAGVTRNPINRNTAMYKFKLWGLGGTGLIGVLFSSGTGLGVPIRLWNIGTLARASQDHHLTLITTLWLGSSSAIDILLSGYTIYALRKADKGNDERNQVISALVRLTIQAGGLVTALQIATLIMYLRASSTWADFPAIFISKVYSMTLITSISKPRQIQTRSAQPPLHTPTIFGHSPMPIPIEETFCHDSSIYGQRTNGDACMTVGRNSENETREHTLCGSPKEEREYKCLSSLAEKDIV